MATPHLAGGGAERSVLRLASGLIERGYAVDILLFHPERGIAYPSEVPPEARLFVLRSCSESTRSKQEAAPFEGVFEPRRPYLTVAYRVVREIGLEPFLALRSATLILASSFGNYFAQVRPDVVIGNLAPMDLATVLACKVLPDAPAMVPVLHNTPDALWPNQLRRFRALMPFANPIATVSDGIADRASVLLNIPRQQFATIYNPIPLRQIRRLGETPPNHPWYRDEGPPVILGAGRFEPQKDFHALIRAFAYVHSQRPCRLVILGQGKTLAVDERMRREYRQTACDLGVGEAVSFPGFQSNPFSFMRHSAVFTLSSRHEGMAVVLAEALACGCPCVSTDCPYGPSEILDQGRYGRLAPVNDPKALGREILATLEAPPSRQSLIDRASDFGMDSAVNAYEQAIARAIHPA